MHQLPTLCPLCNTATYVIAAPPWYRNHGFRVITVNEDGLLHSCQSAAALAPDTIECACGALKTDGQTHTHRPRDQWPGRIEARLGGLDPPADTAPTKKTPPSSPQRATEASPNKGGIGL